MKFTSIITHAAVLGGVSAVRNCVWLDVPVSVHTQNFKYDTLHVDSAVDAAEFTRDLDKWNTKPLPERVLGTAQVDADFTVSAQLCVAQGPKAGTLQIATHGFGLNKKYWGIRYQAENYSYVDAALAAGYSVLTYDRLGTGNSSKPDAYGILQTPVQAEVLKCLTNLALSGTLISASTLTPIANNTTPETFKGTYTAAQVVHVGHSYGSGVTNHFLSQYGNLSAGALLTGYLVSPEFAKLKVQVADLAYAPAARPDGKFADRGSGYVTYGSRQAFQLTALRKQTMDEVMLDVWTDKLQDTGAIGEMFSLGVGFGVPVVGFKGPLQMIVGEFDFGYCLGDCKGAFDPTAIRALYPAASNVDVYLQPGTGHALTMSTNATMGYKEMFDYLARNGL